MASLRTLAADLNGSRRRATKLHPARKAQDFNSACRVQGETTGFNCDRGSIFFIARPSADQKLGDGRLGNALPCRNAWSGSAEWWMAGFQAAAAVLGGALFS